MDLPETIMSPLQVARLVFLLTEEEMRAMVREVPLPTTFDDEDECARYVADVNSFLRRLRARRAGGAIG